MNLIVFDCDETLWTTPYKESDYYMNLPESITNHTFEYKDDIVNILKEKQKDPNNKIVLLTNRHIYVKDFVLERLKKDRDIDFDYVLFREDNRDKSVRLRRLIRSLKGVKNVEFYDDKHKHRKSIRGLRLRFLHIKFKTFKNF